MTEAIHVSVPRVALARGYSPDEVWASAPIPAAVEKDLPEGWIRAKAGPAGPNGQEYGLASFRELGLVFFPDPPLTQGDKITAVMNGTVTGLLRSFVPEQLGYIGFELPMLRLFKPEARSVTDWFNQSTHQPAHFGVCWSDLTEMLYEPAKGRQPQRMTLGFSRQEVLIGAYSFIEHTPISFGWFSHRLNSDLRVAIEFIQQGYAEDLISDRVRELGKSAGDFAGLSLVEIEAALGIEAFAAARHWYREVLTEEDRGRRIAALLANWVPHYRKVIALAPVIRPTWWEYAADAETQPA